ncbi:receptor-like protein kinase ANXUR1 isoform X1 [Trifolium pratense]|uniref:receptor-like protein kinase ANXUR1 isoform X1 n=1 Tax=Trifolium pratense TaxID=57577 RepID=UPI001E692DFD|nr:receptor-like protein kinase ANXUR1 isoform X1 [Trifolium pratense]
MPNCVEGGVENSSQRRNLQVGRSILKFNKLILSSLKPITLFSINNKLSSYVRSTKHNGESDYPIAVKVMKRRDRRDLMKNIIELHCQLHHPNLISLIGFCENKYVSCLVYEYMCNGSLHDRLLSRDMESLSWKKRLEISIEVAKGLHYLHTGAKRPIFNRDITTHNILLDSKMVPKLKLEISLQGKFSKLNQKPIQVDAIFGTINYMAPEYALYGTVTDKSDVYSFGMVLLDVACTNYNLTIRDKIEMFRLEEEIAFLEDHNEVLLLYEDILKGDNFWDKFLDAEIIDPILMRLIALPCLEVYMDIAKRCLKSDPNERPAMGEVEVELEHALALQEEEEKCWKE